MKVVPGASLLFLWLAGTAHAQDDASRVELTVFGAYRFGGTITVEETSDSYDLEDSGSFGLILNFPHKANTKWEVFYSKQATEAEFSAATPNDPVIDIDLQVLQLGGTYQFEGDKVVPYLAATIGGTHAKARSTGSGSDTFFSGSIGVGMLIVPSSRIGLRLEARAHGTLMNSSTDLFCETGPDINACAIRIQGDLLTQIETFAGVVFRF
jgi:hypothetical protein